MGKKGDELRRKKAEQVTYTFTKAQLIEHDKAVIAHEQERMEQRTRERIQDELDSSREQIKDFINQEWEAREALFKGDNFSDNFFLVLCLLLAVSTRVLIEKFGWKPVPKDDTYDRRNRTVRFADALIDEINGIMGNEEADIRRYCEETYELYGVRFEISDE